MATDHGGSWQPRSRVGAVVAALLVGDEAAAQRAVEAVHDDAASDPATDGGAASPPLTGDHAPGDQVARSADGDPADPSAGSGDTDRPAPDDRAPDGHGPDDRGPDLDDQGRDDPAAWSPESDSDKEPLVLAAAIRLAVRSLFDEGTEDESIADYVATMARDIVIDQDIAEALIRAQFGDERVLDPFPEAEVIDTTWSLLGYLCERQLGRDDSLELIAQAEQEALEPS